MLAALWSQLLEIKEVGVQDNFFNLGGDSILSMRLVAAARSQGLEFALTDLFQHPTVAGLASVARLKTETRTAPDVSLAGSEGQPSGLSGVALDSLIRMQPTIQHDQSGPTPAALPKTTGLNDELSESFIGEDITPVPRERPLPLSPGEELLWLMAQISPSYATQHLFMGRRFTGPLNVAALECSVNEIVRRHEILRTTFSMSGIGKYVLRLLVHAARSPASQGRSGRIDSVASRIGRIKLVAAAGDSLLRFTRAVIGHPMRVIAPFADIPLPIIDLQKIPVRDREQEASRMEEEEVSRVFNLAKGPLLRMKLLKLDEEDHVFMLTFHHVICDGWSRAIFTRELQHCYEAYAAGRKPDLPDLRIQYADYAVWRRAQMGGEVFRQHLEFWKDRLKGLPSELPLPVDHPRPPVPSLPSASIAFGISGAQVQGLKRLIQQEGATLFMALLAVFQLLLYRLSGLEDVAVAVPFAARGHSGLEDLIGFFMGLVAVRTDLSGKPSFQELLRRVRETCQGAYAHYSSAIVQAVMHEAGVQGFAQARGSRFKAFFNWISVPTHELALPRLRTELFLPNLKTPELGPDIVLEGREIDGTLDMRVIYKEPLFSAARMEKFTQQFAMLVSQVIEEPEKVITEYRLGVEEEHTAALSAGIATDQKYRLTRNFVLRTTGFPIELIDGLGNSHLAAVTDQALAARQRCADEAQTLLSSPLPLSRSARRKIKQVLPLNGDAGGVIPREVKEYNLRFAREAELRQQALEVYQEELENTRRRLYKTVVSEPFQQVLLLSSPELSRFTPTQLDPPALRNSHIRQRELSWVSYLQRVTTKNETVSFFGPCAWGEFDPQENAAARVELCEQPVDKRIVYIERWVCEALAACMSDDPEVQPLLPLRLADALIIRGDQVILNGKSRALTQEEGDFLRSCAVSAQKDTSALAQKLVEQKYLIRDVQLSPDPLPFRTLQKVVVSWPNQPARNKWQGRLEEIERCRVAIESAEGLEARRSAISKLTATLKSLGLNDHVGAQTLYASRLPINEDCRLATRKLALGKPFMEQLLEDAVPWYDLWRDMAGLYATRLHESMEQAVQGMGQKSIPLPMFWSAIVKAQKQLAAIETEIQKTWHKQLGDRSNQPVVVLTQEDTAFLRNNFRFRSMKAFDNLSPDLQIIAADAQAISDGRWNLLIAEIHPDFTSWQHCFFVWCPDPEGFAKDYASQGEGSTAVLGQFPPYFSSAHTSLWIYPLAHQWTFIGAPAANGFRSVRTADVSVVITQDDVLLTDSSGHVLGSLLHTWRTSLNTHRLVLGGDASHSPRLQVGRVIVQRESWLLEPDPALCEAVKGGGYAAFAGLREFQTRHRLPEQVFVRAHLPQRLTLDKDIKPVFMDFRNPLLVEMLGKMILRLKKLLFTEMLPKPDECWLKGSQGRHSSEFRTVIMASGRRDEKGTRSQEHIPPA
jgi:aryl carrier-like protein